MEGSWGSGLNQYSAPWEYKQTKQLIVVNIDRQCTDVRQYDASLISLLDKHAPSKHIHVVERPMNNWMADYILVLKAIRQS